MSRRMTVILLSTSAKFGIVALALAMSSCASAAVLTWNATGSGAGPADGGGTWSSVAGAWWTGSTNTIWSNANFDTAVFGAGSGAAGSVTISGSVAAGAVTFNPPGAGNYTLGGGTLVLGGASPTITVNSSAEIDATIAGSGGLTVNGPGTLTITATGNAYAGGTNIVSGTLAATGSASFGSGPITVGSSGTMAFVVSGSQQQPIVTNDVAGPGTINAIDTTSNQEFFSGNWSNFAGVLNIPGSGAGIQILGSNNTGSTKMAVNVNGFLFLYQGATGNTPTYNIGSLSGTGSVGGTSTSAVQYTVSVGGANTSSTFGGSIEDSISNQGPAVLSLIKVGSGMLSLTGPNLMNGAVTISGGSLALGSGGTAGLFYGTLPVTDNGTLVYNRSDPQYALGNAVTGSGGLTMMGPGQLTLNAASSYTGPTVISGGTLSLSSGLAGFGAGGTNWKVNSSGISSTPIVNNVLLLTDNSTSETRSAFYTLPVSTGAFYASFIYRDQGARNGDGTAFVLQNSSNGASALGSDGRGLGYGSISPSVGLLLNTYQTASASQTALATDGAIGTYYGTVGLALTSSNPIQVSLSYDGSSTFTETLTNLFTLATFSKTYTGINLAQTLGSSTAYVGFTGADGGGNAYGYQTISSFVFDSLSTGANNVLPATTPLSLAPGAVLNMAGGNQTISSLSDTVPGAGGSQIVLGSGSLVVGDSTSTTFSGTIAGTGGSLAKVGSGTLTLAGTNTYTGPTTISGGKLVVNGALTNSTVTVQSGGTLGGTGTLAGVIVYSGGQLAPGDAPGRMTLAGPLTLFPEAILDYELGSPSNSDEIYMPSAALSLYGQQFSNFVFTPLDGFGPGTYDLIDAGSIGGSLGASTSGTIDGYPATLAVQGSEVVLNVVPEPSTLAILGAGAIALIATRWPRRRRFA